MLLILKKQIVGLKLHQSPIILTFSTDKERNQLLQYTRKKKIITSESLLNSNAEDTSSSAKKPIIFKELLTHENKNCMMQQ